MKRVTSFLFWSFFFFLKTNVLIAQLPAGTYYVGTGGWEHYSSLTNSGGLFSAVNTGGGISGNVQVEITTDLLAETGSTSLNAWSGGFTLTIKPQNNILKSISMVSCTNTLINLSGVNNLIIDGSFGGTGKYLRFTSVCNANPVFKLSTDCKNITLKNIMVASDNASSSTADGGAILVLSNQSFGSDSLHIFNSTIEDLSGPADLFFGVQVNPPSSNWTLDGLRIENCHFRNVNGKSILIRDNVGIGSVEGAMINRNHFFADLPISGPGNGWEYTAVQFEVGSGHTVRGNWIGGQGIFCGGSKLPIVFGPASELVSLIRFRNSVPNANLNQIDSNVIRNISINGNPSILLNTTFIRIENGNCNVGTITGNIIGDTAVNASAPATASITYQENFNSTNNEFRGIYNSSTGSVNIENNVIGGILLKQSTPIGVIANIISSQASTNNIRANIIGGAPNNIVKQSDGDLRIINADQPGTSFDIKNNTIAEISTSNAFSSTFYGIRVINGSGIPTIQNNIIDNINIGNAPNQAKVQVIRTDIPGSVIFNNTITDIILNSNFLGIQLYGINAQGNGGTTTIRDNYLRNLQSTDASTVEHDIVGILVQGTSVYNLDANFITDTRIYAASNISYMRGIFINGTNQNNLINNVVIINNGGLTNDIFIYGIYDNVTSGTQNIWHNTVDIRGNMSGLRRSACYYRLNNAGTRNIQNNIFNNRRSGGTGGHYAMYYSSNGGALTSNYNLLYTEENVNRLVFYTANRSLTTWQALGFDAASPHTLVPQDLVNTTTGYQLTTAGNDIGNTTLGIFIDYADNMRPLGGGYDMGAFELETSSLLSPLPITLLSLLATCNESELSINWTTSSEINNDYFTIEKSVDAIAWEPIASIDGSGNSNIIHTYNYTEAATAGTYYYRLKQTDFDGTSVISDPVSTTCNNTSLNISCFDIFPNPIHEFPLKINYHGCYQGPLDIIILNPLGQLVSTANIVVGPQSGIYPIDQIQNISNGTYLINIMKEGEIVKSAKIIVLNN